MHNLDVFQRYNVPGDPDDVVDFDGDGDLSTAKNDNFDEDMVDSDSEQNLCIEVSDDDEENMEYLNAFRMVKTHVNDKKTIL